MTEDREKFYAHPCRLNTRIQAWTFGPRTQRHLSVVREVRSTAKENVSKADLKEIQGSLCSFCNINILQILH